MVVVEFIVGEIVLGKIVCFWIGVEEYGIIFRIGDEGLDLWVFVEVDVYVDYVVVEVEMGEVIGGGFFVFEFFWVY